MADQRRYAVVGTGARASMYIEALAGEYPGEIVAWCDPNGVRMSFYDEVLAAAGRRLPARYPPGQFDLMLAHERPDVVIVTSPDYTHPAYADGFALECAAMKYARENLGLSNIKLMIPFCRTVQEGAKVVRRMAELGLHRGRDDLEIYVMCEIPNNVLMIDEFSEIFDGFSIGSNDLTQLTLGVDRDSDIVAFDFDERDEGVKRIIAQAVAGCRRNGRHSGLCGQAPSDYPEMADYLVQLGIDSISLNPDTIVATTQRIVDAERHLGRGSLAMRAPIPAVAPRSDLQHRIIGLGPHGAANSSHIERRE